MFNFKHPNDTKALLIGICASIAGVILWDIYKYNKKLFQFKEENNNK